LEKRGGPRRTSPSEKKEKKTWVPGSTTAVQKGGRGELFCDQTTAPKVIQLPFLLERLEQGSRGKDVSLRFEKVPPLTSKKFPPAM